MGFMEKMKEKGRRALVRKYEKEATSAGSTPRVETETVILKSTVKSTSIWKELAVGLVGGRLAPDEVCILRLTNGVLSHWYFQPWAKMTGLPGEHHAFLPGIVNASAWLQLGDGSFGPPNWRSEDSQLAGRLNGDAQLMKHCKKVAFDWRGVGVKKKHQRPLQIRCDGHGRTHVAMLSGAYGFFSDKLGFKVFLNVCQFLTPLLVQSSSAPEGTFGIPLIYAPVAIAEARS